VGAAAIATGAISFNIVGRPSDQSSSVALLPAFVTPNEASVLLKREILNANLFSDERSEVFWCPFFPIFPFFGRPHRLPLERSHATGGEHALYDK